MSSATRMILIGASMVVVVAQAQDTHHACALLTLEHTCFFKVVSIA